jgi:hypothetical protein
VCGEEVGDDEIVDLGEGRVICKSCMRKITKRGIKELLSEMEFGVVDTILEKLL